MRHNDPHLVRGNPHHIGEAVFGHVLPEAPPRDEDVQPVSEVLEEDAEGNASTIVPLLVDEFFHLRKIITDLAWPSRESEEVLGVLKVVELVLAHRGWSNAHDDGDVHLGDMKVLTALEHLHDLELSGVSPEILVFDCVKKGNDSGLVGLWKLVGSAGAIANFSRGEVVWRDVFHYPQCSGKHNSQFDS